ncbi:MAG TPA: YncE family protein [Pyrinomonadaceae bacterium]|nr:YncE family protein [Pyrinomonadaceae bacterium]
MKRATHLLLAAALLAPHGFAPAARAFNVAAQQPSAAAPAPARPDAGSARQQPAPRPTPQEIVSEGIRIEFDAAPVSGEEQSLVAGRDALVRFRVTDTTTKTPLAGLRPSAWMSLREGEAATPEQCRERVRAFVQGSLRARPDVDLNAYYILALNQEPNISVIDPLLGFGGSKLVTLVFLRSPGADWALTSDRSKLFVSMPAAGQVAVVDTATWKVTANVEAGAKPTRVRLQPDEKYLWVTNAGEGAAGGGVTVLDAATLKPAATFAAAGGAADLAFDADNKFAFIAGGDGTLSVVDAQKLVKAGEVKVGSRAVAVAYSPLSRAVYVAGEDGRISVVDARTHKLLTALAARPGLRSVRFEPGGRYGFAVNAADSNVYVFDASTNRLLHAIAVGQSPDQISFTGAFAYVRSAGSGEVSAVRLSTVGKEPDVTKFPGGQLAPNSAPDFEAVSDAIVPAPEGNAVLIANAADKQIYFYSEGMAAPMGNFQNYKRVPRSVRVVDRSLREGPAGTYSTVIKPPRSGRYDVAFLLDSPRVVHCFRAEAAPDPAAPAQKRTALRVEYLNDLKKVVPGRPLKISFKLYDTATGRPKDGLKDVRVLVFLAPGIWQVREFAQGAGEGVYELTVTPPEPGVYMVFVESQSQGVGFRQLPTLTLHAEAAPEAR